MKPRTFLKVGLLPSKSESRSEVAEHIRRTRKQGRITRYRYPDGSKAYQPDDKCNPYVWIVGPHNNPHYPQPANS
jgi:hypothetical protein